MLIYCTCSTDDNCLNSGLIPFFFHCKCASMLLYILPPPLCVPLLYWENKWLLHRFGLWKKPEAFFLFQHIIKNPSNGHRNDTLVCFCKVLVSKPESENLLFLKAKSLKISHLSLPSLFSAAFPVQSPLCSFSFLPFRPFHPSYL